MEHREAIELLGLRQPFSQTDVKAAFKRLAGRTHPDKGGSSSLFQEARKAYDVCLTLIKSTGAHIHYNMLDVIFKARYNYIFPGGLTCGFCAGDGYNTVPEPACQKCDGTGEVPSYLQDVLGSSCACVKSVTCAACGGSGAIPKGASIAVDIKSLHSNGYRQVFEVLDGNHPFVIHGKFDTEEHVGTRRIKLTDGRVSLDLYSGEERTGIHVIERTLIGTELDIAVRNIEGVLTLHINGLHFKLDPVFP